MTSIAATSLAILTAGFTPTVASDINVTKGLLNPQETITNTSFTLLNNTIGAGTAGDATAGLSSLEQFIQEFVPQNEQLLADLSAVTALSSLLSDDTTSSPSSAFLNPFTQTLALQQNAEAEEQIGLEVSLLV